MSETSELPTAKVPPASDLVFGASADLERIVRQEVEIQLAKEQKILKESVAIAAKIIGAAAALFLAIFTVFGLTTWRDIKQEATQLVKKQAEELIQQADSESNIKDTLNDLLNKTIVTSHLASHTNVNSREVELASNDWGRLRGWIKKEELPLQDFLDTLALLNLQSDERKKVDANRLIAEMLNPPEKSPYRWITKQPEKTEAILANFKHKDLGSSAVELVASAALTDSVKAQAARYVGEVSYDEGVEKLLTTYRTLPWGMAKQSALKTCVELRPDQSEVIEELKRLIGEEPRREKIDTIVNILAALPHIKSTLDLSINQDELNTLSKDLLRYAAKNGLYFNLEYPNVDLWSRSRLSEDDVGPANQVTPRPFISWMVTTSKHSASGAGSMSIREFREFETYWQLLAEWASASDIERLRSFFLRAGFPVRSNPSSPQLRVMVSADSGASITVKRKGQGLKELDLQSLKSAHIIATSEISDPEVRITWLDDRNQPVTAEVVGFKGKGYKFALTMVNDVN
ncbi:hypothetical protein ACQE3E_16375 [Methylomonas sp. MED-D]|uniref:hypothetical protein n=1 Tax=unclassified Methylomonas TaxID=2608980 RepID=UPI0028A43EA2|nr:hypothetical protein [Methylomonas sp. MV1]MDT4331066.1 hypothetical protein [Methylomonas sp. MV1]